MSDKRGFCLIRFQQISKIAFAAISLLIALVSYSCKDPLEMDDYKQTRYINEKRIIYVTAWNSELSQPDVYMIDWDSTSMVLVAENVFALSSTAERQLPILSRPIAMNTISGATFSFFNVSSSVLANTLKLETNTERFCCVTISPDRKLLAYSPATDPGRISIMNIETGISSIITTKAQSDSKPKFSLSGRFLAFVQSGGGMDSVMVYETETGILRAIGTLNMYTKLGLSTLDWSADSKEVIAIEAESGGHSALFGFRTDSAISRVIITENQQIYGAAFSPDGTQIAIATADAAYLISPQGTKISDLPSQSVLGTVGKRIEWELGGTKMIIHHITGTSGSAFHTGTIEFLDLRTGKSSFPVQSTAIINAYFPTIGMD